MTPGPLPSVDVPDPRRRAQRSGGVPQPARPVVTTAGPDDPSVVVVAGPAGANRRELIAALLRIEAATLTVPPGSNLLVRHAATVTRVAYVPGYRRPHPYDADPPVARPARPPRRVELGLPDPLLRHFTVVDTPDTGTLGVAGGRVLRDAVGRAGALLFVISADQAFSAAELHLLAEVARTRVEVFFAVTPGGAVPDRVTAVPPPGRSGSTGRLDPVSVSTEAHRATLLAAVPALDRARWFPARRAELPRLRRALVGWADEVLRRTGARPPAPDGTLGRVPVPAGVEPGELADRIDRQARASAHRIRQHLALELANIHLRVVQEIVFGAGCAGLPPLLDRELEALSLLATAQCDEAARDLVDEAAARVFGEPPAEGVRRRITHAVRRGVADHPDAAELDRVLLVTSTAGVAGLTGPGALDALAGLPGASRDEVLPPVGVALNGGCWQHWRAPGNDDPNAARSWAQRALREVELELSREVSQRFEVIRLSLGTVLADAVDHGILLA
ncbi:hypothetical protein ACFYPF_02140 [Micromonospora sp. NPDC005223]|uniref:hypothetical protein n=2 Tax=Micromonospora TaxID=1873 RepID=UPI0033AF552A